ncbi:MAG: hypothetical protein ABI378_01350 [Chitinophagaceae bacterium]
MNIPTVTPEFERLSPGKVDSLSRKLTVSTEGKTYIEEQKQSTGFIARISNADSYFKVIKNYAPGGQLRDKGVIFNSGSFPIGKWYYFNESGQLTKTEDNDTGYRFDFEDLYKFLEKHNISLTLGAIPPLSGFHTTIEKKEQAGQPVWVVTWKKEPQLLEEIILDGKNGRVISTKDKPITEG